MTDGKRLMSDQSQPYGRRFGRTLDPLDYREGYPHNGVELVGAFGLDSKKEELAKASARGTALQTAKAKSKAATAAAQKPGVSRPIQHAGAAPIVNADGSNAAPPVKVGTFSLDGLKGAAPYMAITAVLVVVVAHFAFGKG